MFTVTVSYSFDNKTGTFGPFENRDSAEECVLVLASREDVREAKISESYPCN